MREPDERPGDLGQRASSPEDGGQRRKKIFAVDDAVDLLSITQTFLEGEGYEVVTCSVAREAVQRIKQERPDLLILDVRMPGALDWHVYDQVRGDPAMAQIPCIISSAAEAQLQEREAELVAAGCEVLDKAFDIDDLLAKVKRLIGPASHGAADARGSR